MTTLPLASNAKIQFRDHDGESAFGTTKAAATTTTTTPPPSVGLAFAESGEIQL